MAVLKHYGRTLRVAPKIRCYLCGTRLVDPSRRVFSETVKRYSCVQVDGKCAR